MGWIVWMKFNSGVVVIVNLGCEWMSGCLFGGWILVCNMY